MKIESIPKSGRQGNVVFVKGRYGNVVREFVPPSNPRTADQQSHRHNLHAVSARWHTLTPDQRGAWRALAATTYFITETGERVRRNCYTLFVALNTRRADLGLPQFDVPPAQPVFPKSPVVELLVTNIGARITIKLRVLGSPTQLILVGGSRPVRAAVRCVQHFPFLGLVPAPIDGWCDITDLYVARYGVPKAGNAIWIRTCQHIDGWIDVPQVFRFRVPTPTS
jgi:hypothetical protein